LVMNNLNEKSNKVIKVKLSHPGILEVKIEHGFIMMIMIFADKILINHNHHNKSAFKRAADHY